MSGESQEEQEQWKGNLCLAMRDAMGQGTAWHSRGGILLPREFKQVRQGLGLCLARLQRGGMAEGSTDPRNPRAMAPSSVTGAEPAAAAARSLPRVTHDPAPITAS